MRIRITLRKGELEALLRRLKAAYRAGNLWLVRRIHALLDIILDGKTFAEVAELLGLSEQTIRNYVNSFILKRLDSLKRKRPCGRPRK